MKLFLLAALIVLSGPPIGARSPATLARGVSSGGTPASPVAGSTLWLDASDAATLTLSGAAVTQWNDKSGNGRNFTQATSGARPDNTGTIGGLTAVHFDGFNQDFMTSTATLANVCTSSTCTIIAVFKTSSVDSSGTSYNCVLSESNLVFRAVAIKTTTLVGWRHNDGSSVDMFATTSSTSSGLIATVQHSGGNIRAKDADNAYGTDVASGNTSSTTGTLQIGEGSGATPFFKGDLGELLIYNTALSAADVTLNYQYLHAKWGV